MADLPDLAVVTRYRTVSEQGFWHTIRPCPHDTCVCEAAGHRHTFASNERDANQTLVDLRCTCGCPTHVRDQHARHRGQTVFVTMADLEEVAEQDRWDSQVGKVLLLDPETGAALEDIGFAEQETKGGWHRTDALVEWMKGRSW